MTVGTRAQFDEARRALLEREKELTRLSDEIARERQALPWVPVEVEYEFITESGRATLADLFDGRSQLIVYHFMFGPDWDEGCPSCSSLGDHIELPRVHLENHDVTWVAVSRAPLAKLLAYKERMGWTFPWVSSYGSDFNFDFGVSSTEDRPLLEYNYRALPPARAGAGELPGASMFALRDGVVYHTYSTYARGLDALWGMFQWLDRAPLGRNEADGYWIKRHDQYAPAAPAALASPSATPTAAPAALAPPAATATFATERGAIA
jgi:predicted dithiol-disulfide oxidoreductase (DUF899 family)